MTVTVFDRNVQKKSIYETFVSLLWQVKYNDMGSFCLELNENAETIGAINTGDYITISDDANAIMVVTSIEVSKGKIVLRGQTADFLLTTRVSDTVVKNCNAEAAMRSLVQNMMPIPHLTLGDAAGFEDTFTAQTSDKSIQEYCKVIASAADMGYRIRRSGDALLFECYKPPLNTGVKYSAALGNLTEERFSESITSYANVAVVAGQGSGDARVTVTVGETDSTGLERAEIYVDARNIQQEDGETDESYIERLSAFGMEKLAERNKIVNTQFTVSDGGASLGDLVQIVPTYSGNKLTARVISATIKCQNNTIIKTLAVGTPIAAGK